LKTILLLGLAGGKNKGNLALLYSITGLIKEHYPDCKFVLATYEADMDEYIANLNIDKVPRIGEFSIKNPNLTLITIISLVQCIFLKMFKKMGKKILASKKSPVSVYYSCDLIIQGGGDTMSGENGYAVLFRFFNLLFGILLDKPIVLFCESIGYYKNSLINFAAKITFSNVKFIILRETYSEKYLKENLPKVKYYLSSDPAFLLHPVSENDINKIFLLEKIKFKKPVIGINPSGLISRYQSNNGNNQNEIIKIYAQVIDEIITQLNIDILLIPHVYSPPVDDRIIIRSIYGQIKNKSNVYKIDNEYSPQELKAIIGKCEIFIGARMHATIASVSMLVPTIGIAYSHKMYGIIGEQFGQNNYILNIKDFNYEKLKTLILLLWREREKVKVDLSNHLPKVVEKSKKNGIIIKSLLEDANAPYD
jgi:colanic acid/amylovoran biosynthesis protein